MPRTCSVCIPTLNEARYLPQLLSNLAEQTLTPAEILVIDGGSQDETQQIVRTWQQKLPQLRLIKSQQGVAAQRTLGGKQSRSELILYADADTLLDKDFIEKMITNFTLIQARRKVACACPVFVPVTSNPIVTGLFWFLNNLFWMGQRRIPAGAGVCILVEKSAAQSVGWFDQTSQHEDLTFIQAVGKKFGYAILPVQVHTSDRRFRRDGVLTTTLHYLEISGRFITGRLSGARKYEFGGYDRVQK